MIRAILFWVLLSSTAFAGVSTNGNPGSLKSAATVWAVAPTNWPDALWVYKVVPQNFAEPVVSNLMAIGSFTQKDRTKSPSYLSDVDKKTIYFVNDSKYLAICPTLGYVEYHDGNADARMGEPVIGVPEESAVLPLGLKYLRMAGIDRSQLAVRPGTEALFLHGEKGDRNYVDKTSGQRIEAVDSRGVFFLRRIDNIDFNGIGIHGGVNIRFGNNSNVVDFKICWRNLIPYELRACPTPEQIAQWIHSGKATLMPGPGATPQNVSRFAISKGRFFYEGKPGDEAMDFVSPYAFVDVAAEGERATNTITFKVPMTLPPGNQHR